jgi:hypothetical protein
MDRLIALLAALVVVEVVAVVWVALGHSPGAAAGLGHLLAVVNIIVSADMVR